MRHDHCISIEAVRQFLVQKTKGAPYTTDMIVRWIEKNRRPMNYAYVGSDMFLTFNQALRVAVGVHLDLDYDELDIYFKKGRRRKSNDKEGGSGRGIQSGCRLFSSDECMEQGEARGVSSTPTI